MKYHTQHEEYPESERLASLLDAQVCRLGREFLRAHGFKRGSQVVLLAHDLHTERQRRKVRPE